MQDLLGEQVMELMYERFAFIETHAKSCLPCSVQVSGSSWPSEDGMETAHTGEYAVSVLARAPHSRRLFREITVIFCGCSQPLYHFVKSGQHFPKGEALRA